MSHTEQFQPDQVNTPQPRLSRRSVLGGSIAAAASLLVSAAPLNASEEFSETSPIRQSLLAVPRHEDFLGGV